MRLQATFSAGENLWTLPEVAQPLDLDDLLPGDGDWEVEIGFGKGRYLLESSIAHPERRFLGLEVVSKYYRMLQRRGQRHGVDNLLLIRGEALYLLSTALPSAFASTLHVYFPDPWPKSRHQRRRLLDPETIDLVLGVLRPGGELWFATDFIEYGERVQEILEGYPGLAVTPHPGEWPGGARTNYEAKYIAEGRPVLRLRARLDQRGATGRLHPEGRGGIVAAPTRCLPTAPD